jgi:hypothetical protein
MLLAIRAREGKNVCDPWNSHSVTTAEETTNRSLDQPAAIFAVLHKLCQAPAKTRGNCTAGSSAGIKARFQ